MIKFQAFIQKFGNNKEKTGWTYVVVPPDIAMQLHSADRRSFRVKGFLDQHAIESVAVMPMGDGEYMLTLNGPMRKAIRKSEGAILELKLEPDLSVRKIPEELLECLEDEPEAQAYFNSLNPSHQNYFGNWVKDAKTYEAKVKRILKIINALRRKMDYGQMIREKEF